MRLCLLALLLALVGCSRPAPVVVALPPAAVGQTVDPDDATLVALARSGGDCTAALQARFDAARDQWGGAVRLPDAQCVYRITDTLTLGGPPGGGLTGGGSCVSLYGPPGGCTFDYRGPTDRPALRIDRMWGYRLEGVAVTRGDNLKLGVGIEACPPPGFTSFGTVGGNAHWDQVSVYNFGTGAKLGDYPRSLATSEITFTQCVFGNCDVGCKVEDFNTLNMVFLNLGISGNRLGLWADTGGRVSVLGGTASNNTDADIWIVHAHNGCVTGFRSEGTNCLFRGPGVTAPQGISITNCSANQKADSNMPAIFLSAAGRIAIRECHISGGPTVYRGWWNSGIQVASNGGGCTVSLENCMIESDRPAYVGTLAHEPTSLCALYVKGCTRIGPGNTMVARFPDTAQLLWGNIPAEELTQVIDDGDAGCTLAGTWASYVGQGYQGDVRDTPKGDGSSSAAWSFTVEPGKYRVYATWSHWPNRPSNAPYTVFDGAAALATVRVNQRDDPGRDWKCLGEYDVTGTALSVKLTNDCDANPIADAVKIVRIP